VQWFLFLYLSFKSFTFFIYFADQMVLNCGSLTYCLLIAKTFFCWFSHYILIFHYLVKSFQMQFLGSIGKIKFFLNDLLIFIMKLAYMLIIKWIWSSFRLNMLQRWLCYLKAMLSGFLKSLTLAIINRIRIKSFLCFISIFNKVHMLALNIRKLIFTVSSLSLSCKASKILIHHINLNLRIINIQIRNVLSIKQLLIQIKLFI